MAKKGFILLSVLLALIAFGFGSQTAFAQGSVAGTVIDAEGAAVAGAMVNIHGMGGFGRGQRPFMERAETDENGAFGFEEVPEGDYTVTAMARELGMAHARIEVADGEETAVELQMRGFGGGGGDEEGDQEFGSVSGTVVDVEGNAVAEARVVIIIRQEGEERGRFMRRHVRHVRGVTDDNGEFSFDEVPVGEGIITAGKRELGMVRAQIEVIVDENTEVDLQLQVREDHGDDDGEGEDGGRRGRWWDRRDRKSVV